MYCTYGDLNNTIKQVLYLQYLTTHLKRDNYILPLILDAKFECFLWLVMLRFVKENIVRKSINILVRGDGLLWNAN